MISPAASLKVPNVSFHCQCGKIIKAIEAAIVNQNNCSSSKNNVVNELIALRRRIIELEEENAILKKAEAYFAKHDR